METTQNKFFIIIIIDYYPREHISQNVTTVLRDQGEWHLLTGDRQQQQQQQQQQTLIIVR